MKKLILFFLCLIGLSFSNNSFGQTWQIGTGATTNNYHPIYSCYGYNYSQQIYTATEVSTALGPNYKITNIRFRPTTTPGTISRYNNWTVYIGNTSQTEFATPSSWIPLSELTQVYTGTVGLVANNWVDITLATPFWWDGASNLVVAIDENSPNYSCTAAWSSYTSTGNSGILYYNDTNNPNPASPPNANRRTNTLPQIQFAAEPPPPCTGAAPTGVQTTNVSATTATFSWFPALNATYVLQYREQGTSTWTTVAPANSNYTVTGLDDNTNYEWQVAYICSGTQGAFTTIQPFSTPSVSWCTQNPTSSSSIFGYISNVTVIPDGAVALVNNTVNNGYTDYSSDPTKVVTLVRNSTDNTVSVGKSWPGNNYPNHVNVWIDFNRDGDFDDPDEHIIASMGASNATPIVSDPFPVPAGAYAGNKLTKMRVSLSNIALASSCGNFSLGEVEDYGVQFIDLPPCTVAAPDPVVVVNVQPSSALVTWTGTAGATYTVRYREVGTATWITVPASGTSNHYLNSLEDDTQYEVQISTTCGGATSGWSNVVTFTTPEIEYCTPSLTPNSNSEWISNVTVTPIAGWVPASTMSNNSTGSGYIDYSSDPSKLVTLVIGSPDNEISVSKSWGTTSTNDESIAVWIDFNRNGIFENSEKVLNDAPNQTTPVSDLFDVPANAYSGPSTVKMRVVLRRGSASTDPCVGFPYGEIEDYAVKLNERIPCSNASPTNVTVTSITSTSATVTWDQDPGWASYWVRYRPIGSTTWVATIPVATNTAAPPVTNSYNLINLTPGTQYEVEVIALCDNTPGTPTNETFDTLCDPAPPSGLSITNISSTSAVVNWNSVGTSATYELWYREVGSGTWIGPVSVATNTYTLTGLSPYTHYEVKVASVCSGSSNQQTTPKVFTTEPTCDMAPVDVTITNITMNTAQIDWNEIPGATYILQYREVGFTTWTTVNLAVNTYTIMGLTEQTQYELQIANVCNGAPQTFTHPYVFTTPAVVYCDMASQTSSNYIGKVKVVYKDDVLLDITSGASSYTDFTNDPLVLPIFLLQGSSENQITIEKKLTGTDEAAVTAWMDFNRDGKFENHERILAFDPSNKKTVTASFSVPANAYVSLTDDKYFVMRVALSKDVAPAMCGEIADGEVEDYKVRIVKSLTGNFISGTKVITVYPNPALDNLYITKVSDGATYTIYSSIGQVAQAGIIQGNVISVRNLISGVYIIDIDNKGKEKAQIKFIKE